MIPSPEDIKFLVEYGIMPLDAAGWRGAADAFRNAADWCDGIAEQIENGR